MLQSKGICKFLILVTELEEIKYETKVENLNNEHLPKMTVIPMTHLMKNNCLNFINFQVIYYSIIENQSLSHKPKEISLRMT